MPRESGSVLSTFLTQQSLATVFSTVFPPPHSMFALFSPAPLATKAPRWAKKSNGYRVVFGFSPFADLFVCSEDQSRFAVISTEKPELIELKSGDMSNFTEQFLGSEKIRDDFFRAHEYRALCERLGELQNEECFFPVPFRSIGGSGALDTYAKGNAWVHLDIYGQTIGL
jgi:hypothetical protein